MLYFDGPSELSIASVRDYRCASATRCIIRARRA